MGLGKTLEVLATILMHQRINLPESKMKARVTDYNVKKKNEKDKVLSCLCGHAPDSQKYTAVLKGKRKRKFEDTSEMYQCRLCDAWTHIDCVNYTGLKEDFLCLTCCTKVPLIPSK